MRVTGSADLSDFNQALRKGHNIPRNIEKTLPDCFESVDPLVPQNQVVMISEYWLNL